MLRVESDEDQDPVRLSELWLCEREMVGAVLRLWWLEFLCRGEAHGGGGRPGEFTQRFAG